jgi:hypothetical protein
MGKSMSGDSASSSSFAAAALAFLDDVFGAGFAAGAASPELVPALALEELCSGCGCGCGSGGCASLMMSFNETSTRCDVISVGRLQREGR